MAFTTLIIDDSPPTRKIISHHFSKAGYVVVGEAGNGAEGLRLFRERQPNVVTLDLIMPEVEGVSSIETLQAMKKAQGDHLIIIVSAVPFERTREECLRAGVLDYIIKPFNQYSFEPVRVKLARVFHLPIGSSAGH